VLSQAEPRDAAINLNFTDNNIFVERHSAV